MKFDLNKSPIDLFASWLDEAKITEPNDPDAMSFATVSSDGYPSVRMVLLKDFNPLSVSSNSAKLKSFCSASSI